MARRGNNHNGMNIGTTIMCLILICALAALMVTSGTWDKIARTIPGLNQTGTSIEAIKPQGDAHDKLGLALPAPTPAPGNTTNDPHPSANSTTQTPPPDTTTQPTPNTSGLPAAAASPISIADALTTAQAMPTAKPHTTGYKANRGTLFGGWANSPQLCGTATMRDQILKRDLTNPVLNDRCQVVSGTFTDPYTGQHMTFKRGKDTSSLIQIDHVVAVYDAYASGLWNRSQQERETYANDPDVLLASQGKANMVKSEGINLNGKGGRKGWTQSTPSIWLPDNRGYQCDYMAKRVHIKHKYNLTMSPWEKDETIAFLTQCAIQ